MDRDLADLIVIVLGFVILGLAAARFGVNTAWGERDRYDKW